VPHACKPDIKSHFGHEMRYQVYTRSSYLLFPINFKGYHYTFSKLHFEIVPVVSDCGETGLWSNVDRLKWKWNYLEYSSRLKIKHNWLETTCSSFKPCKLFLTVCRWQYNMSLLLTLFVEDGCQRLIRGEEISAISLSGKKLYTFNLPLPILSSTSLSSPTLRRQHYHNQNNFASFRLYFLSLILFLLRK
jgi:hypothetical protein